MALNALFSALAKTRTQMDTANVANAGSWEDWHNRLLLADVGTRASAAIVAEARGIAEQPSRGLFVRLIGARLRRLEAMLTLEGRCPGVVVAMGVNGSGKTTTIAKLACHYLQRGNTLLLAAGDTFRAAAREQLQKWAGDLGGLEVIGGSGDPAAVAYSATQAAQARQCDVLIIDTAGRLPTQGALMAELAKIRRAVHKALPGAPHELLLILDATSGQNALTQIDAFTRAVGVTGLIITKLDGSAKGGFLLALEEARPLPVRFIGVGEGSGDLALFDADAYTAALLGTTMKEAA